MTWEEALQELKNCSGTQFDPQVVEALARMVERMCRPCSIEGNSVTEDEPVAVQDEALATGE